MSQQRGHVVRGGEDVNMRTMASVVFLTMMISACNPGGAVEEAAADKGTANLSAEFARLDGAQHTDGAAWYSLAVRAREAGDVATADRALDKAAMLEYSPIRVGLERARLDVLDESPKAAIAELQSLAGKGFTAVGMVTADPLLSSLSGQPAFDSLVAKLSEAAYPCDHQEKFRAFDFWIGEWEVRDGSGNYAGRNVIQPAHKGCALVENWTSASGGTGMSMNFLDTEKNEWVQYWVDSSGGQIEIRGGMTDDGMLLTGQIHDSASGTTAPFRGLWTELPDGRLRQFFEQSNDDGKTWDPWFEGFYTRVDNVDDNMKATTDRTTSD